MGPLFSILLVLTIALPVMLVIFAAARFFLPSWPAFIMTILTSAAGAVGLFLGAAVQVPFQPDTLESTAAVLFFLGFAGVVGVVAAALTAWATWRIILR